MILNHFVGSKFSDLVNQIGVCRKEIRIFVLLDEKDNTGRYLMSGYTIRQILNACPATADAIVAFAENYYGETILRIRAPESLPAKV